jgi:hypothetical protein
MKDSLDTDTMDLIDLIEATERRLIKLERSVAVLQRIARDNDLDFDQDTDLDEQLQ